MLPLLIQIQLQTKITAVQSTGQKPQASAKRWITMGCTRSPFSGGLQCCAFLYGPGEPGRYTASGAITDMIVGARDMFATYSLKFVTYSCRFATCSPRSIPYSRHPRLPRGGRHRNHDLRGDMLVRDRAARYNGNSSINN